SSAVATSAAVARARCSASLWALARRLCRTRASTTKPPATRPTPTTSAARTVSRTRTVVGHRTQAVAGKRGQRLPAIGVETVADAAHGADSMPVERQIDLAAQVVDVHLKHVGVIGEPDIPHLVEGEALGDDLTSPGHQQLEQAELARRQADVDLAPVAAPRRA